ncbi:11057_t:CDS:2 [Ambispora leptoticha]|uniref:11057_t:CDS:1 n=1 Tax=Ambispora leptoticha TaxID=144679 RepID=A0A9N8W9B3_9GLOM|nr:11057_t:CDS:2 [Ambispora leptoticha]
MPATLSAPEPDSCCLMNQGKKVHGPFNSKEQEDLGDHCSICSGKSSEEVNNGEEGQGSDNLKEVTRNYMKSKGIIEEVPNLYESFSSSTLLSMDKLMSIQNQRIETIVKTLKQNTDDQTSQFTLIHDVISNIEPLIEMVDKLSTKVENNEIELQRIRRLVAWYWRLAYSGFLVAVVVLAIGWCFFVAGDDDVVRDEDDLYKNLF